MKDTWNQRLLGILVVLVLVYAALEFLGKDSSRSTSFQHHLVQIDTAQITKIAIDNPSSSVTLVRDEGQWKIPLQNSESAIAMNQRVENMLRSIQPLSPSRIATNDPSKWRDYQVDSTGTRLRIFTGPSPAIDLIIGRTGQQGQGQFYTFVRPGNQKEVFVIDDFMGSVVSASSLHYRDQKILTLNTDSVRSVQFDYPNGESFTLELKDSLWQVDGMVADSANTAGYLQEIRNITSTQFANDISTIAEKRPQSSLLIRVNGSPETLIDQYVGPNDEIILHSSQNPVNYFADTALVNTLFPLKEYFLGGG